MTYLVMEVHPAYAVVLDSQGRFLKVANRNYQVGQQVDRVVTMPDSAQSHRQPWKPLVGLASLAACLCLVFFGYYRPNFSPYGTLRIQINPDVQLTLSHTQRVLGLEGLNEDGWDLIEGYSYHNKSQDTVTQELVERAMEMGYLSDGDTISITVSSSDTQWQDSETDYVIDLLHNQYGDTVTVQRGDTVVIPIAPSTPAPTSPPPTSAPPAATPHPHPGDDDDDETDDQDDDQDDQVPHRQDEDSNQEDDQDDDSDNDQEDDQDDDSDNDQDDDQEDDEASHQGEASDDDQDDDS